MSLTNNLLYLLLLYCVVEEDRKISTTNVFCIAIGLMLFNYCTRRNNLLCNNGCSLTSFNNLNNLNNLI